MHSKNRKWSELTFWEKLAIFNYWSIMYILSDLLLITGCLILMIIRQDAFEEADLFLGLGCFFAWCSLSSYVHHTA